MRPVRPARRDRQEASGRGQSLVEILVALSVMAATSVLFSTSASSYRAMQEYARNTTIYQNLARERLEQMMGQNPGEMLGATTSTMTVLPAGRLEEQLSSAGTVINAVDVTSSLPFIPIVREAGTDAVNNPDRYVDMMALTARALAARVQSLPLPPMDYDPAGDPPRYVLYKYQIEILQDDDYNSSTPAVLVYVLSGLDVDYDGD